MTPVRSVPERVCVVVDDSVSRDVHFVVNPISGRRRRSDLLTHVLGLLQADGWRTHVHETRGPGHAARICRDLPQTHRAVVICGGDGTVSEAASGLAGGQLPLAVLPAGTENLAGVEFGYRADADFVHRLLRSGRVQRVDLGQANGRVFLIVVGVGYDANVASRLAGRRRGHISYASYVLPSIQTWLTYRFPPIRVMADNRELFSGRGLAFVGNLSRYALGIRVLKRARWNDGLLDLCVYPCAGRLKLLTHMFHTWLGRHTEAGRTVYRQCRHIRISADQPVEVQLDGDPGGSLPLEIRVLPDQLPLLLPDPALGP